MRVAGHIIALSELKYAKEILLTCLAAHCARITEQGESGGWSQMTPTLSDGKGSSGCHLTGVLGFFDHRTLSFSLDIITVVTMLSLATLLMSLITNDTFHLMLEFKFKMEDIKSAETAKRSKLTFCFETMGRRFIMHDVSSLQSICHSRFWIC